MTQQPLTTLKLAYGLGIGLFTVALLGGFAYSLKSFGRPPGLALTYGLELDRLVESSGSAGALPGLRRAAELDLNAAAPLWRLLDAAKEAGDRDQQIFALTGLVQAEARRADVAYSLAGLYLEAPNVLLASRYAAVAIERDPGDPRYYCLLGATLLAQERCLEAARQYRAALQIDPRHEVAIRALQGPLQGY